MKCLLQALLSAAALCGGARADQESHPLASTALAGDKAGLKLVQSLQEDLGAGYRVEEEPGRINSKLMTIKIHTVTPVRYTQGAMPSLTTSVNPAHDHSDEFSKTSEIISIEPVTSMDLKGYLKIQGRFYAVAADFQEWKEKLSKVSRLYLKPVGNVAENLLHDLTPATPEEKRLKDEFGEFVKGYTEAAEARREVPTHQFGGALYRVWFLTNGRDVTIEPGSLPAVLLAEHVLSKVMQKLP